MIDCALFEPDIPQYAGAILRLSACFGVSVHFIHPCGFILSDRNLKRVGLDYLSRASLIGVFEALRQTGGLPYSRGRPLPATAR